MTTSTDSQRRPVFVDRRNNRFFADPLIGNGAWPQVPLAVFYGSYAADPASNPYGSQIAVGDLYFNTSANILRVWDGSLWQDAGGSNSSVFRWKKTAAGGETSLSGLDDGSTTLAYTPGSEFLYLNGALLARGADYVATTGTSITGLAALTASDVVEVFSFNALNLANLNAGAVAFTQSGTGAAQRTVEGKLRDVISVKDFGAVGDAARINQALATGKLVNGPKANYVLETNVTPGTGALFLEPGSTVDKPDRLLPRGKASDLGNGVNLWRLQDRVFIGGANKVADTKSPVLDGFGIAGDPAGVNSDYLERAAALISSSAYGGIGASFAARQSLQYSIEGYTTWASGQSVSIGDKRGYYEKLYTATTNGTTGGTPPSHTSGTASDGGVTWQFDNYTYMVPIGLASVADADAVDGHSCWALYLEGLRRSSGGTLLTSEIAVKNKGTDVTANPYNILPGGASVGIWFAGGGDASLGAPANPSTTAIAIGKNAHTWNSGIVFGYDAITANGSAIALATNHKITWHSTDGGERSYITSERTNLSNGGGLKFVDNAIWLNPRGPVALSVTGLSTDTSYFQMESGTTSVSITAQSPAADVGITLSAKGTGRIRLDSTLEFAYSGFTSATTPANFTADRYMVVTDSTGTLFYIPARTATW